MFARKRIKNIISQPNSLTLFRIAVIPIIVILLLFPNRICTLLSTILFTAAAITDYFDGFFARRRDLVSNFGKAMDPLADKLLISSVFIMLSSHGWVPAWIVCIIISRELAVTGLRNIMSENSLDLSASRLGKYKTGFQISAIIPLIIHFEYVGVNFQSIGDIILWIALALTMWSGIDYFIRYRKLFYS